MAIIQKTVRLAGSKGQRELTVIFDSGASYSVIQPELAEQLENPATVPEPMTFGTAKDGETLTATQRVALNFYIGEYRFSDEFMLIPGLSELAIIGATTMQKWRLKLDFEADDIIIDPRVTQLRLL